MQHTADTMTKPEDDVEALLASLTDAEAQETGAESAPPAEPETELQEQDLEVIQAAEDRAEVYAGQASKLSVDPENKAPEEPPKQKKARGKSTKPRQSRSLDDLPKDVFLRNKADTDTDAAATSMRAMRPMQVKIAEKFDNLFAAIGGAAKLSRYTEMAHRMLVSKKTITSAEIVAMMRAENLGAGTAQSQTGQLMALFAATGVADRAGQVLIWRADSAVSEKLSALASS